MNQSNQKIKYEIPLLEHHEHYKVVVKAISVPVGTLKIPEIIFKEE